MCIHPYQLDSLTPTREERLMEVRAVREHHRMLAQEADEQVPGALARFREHRQLHHDAAARLKAERTK